VARRVGEQRHEQAAFATRFFELTDGLDKEMAIWSFLYDPAAQKPFDSMG
jgi:hypothetical protein